jgi:hypothetical protein
LDNGVVLSGIYSNRYFGFALPIPAGWSVSDRKTIEELRSIGAEAVTGKRPTGRMSANARRRSATLLRVSEHPVGAAVDINPSIAVLAEDVSMLPGLKAGKDYLFHLANGLARNPLNYKRLDKIAEVEIGGRTFDRLRFSADNMRTDFYQAIFVTIVNEHALIFVTTSDSLERCQSVEQAVSKVQFN